jgi:glucokinase
MALAMGVVIAQSATRFSALALDTLSRRVWRAREETPLSPEGASAMVAGLVEAAQAETGVEDSSTVAVGCAIEADLDVERERVVTLRYAPGWQDVGFRELLAQRLSGAISLATVTEAAAIAEHQRGAARDQRSLLYILPARGITACYIERGQIMRGAHGAAGSLDHWPAHETGQRCACGGQGHLATLASAQSIVRMMIGRASDSDESTAAMLRVSGGRAEAMSAAHVVELAVAGDPAAQAVIRDAAGALADSLASLRLMLDPGVIVIGGPLALADPYFFQVLNDRLRARKGSPIPAPVVVAGALEPDAALIGAGLLAAGRQAGSPVQPRSA